jgi:hypothetical protein
MLTHTHKGHNPVASHLGASFESPCGRRNADYGTYDSCKEGFRFPHIHLHEVGAGMGVHGPCSALWSQASNSRSPGWPANLSAYLTPPSHGRTTLGIEPKNYQRLIPLLARDFQLPLSTPDSQSRHHHDLSPYMLRLHRHRARAEKLGSGRLVGTRLRVGDPRSTHHYIRTL